MYGRVTASETDDFIRYRFDEGRRWRSVLRHYADSGKQERLLDVGAGNGAIELAFAADRAWSVFSIENAWDDIVRRLRDQSGAKLRRVIADASAMPFRDGSFAAVTCLETVEHLRRPRAVVSEIARVASPGAMLLLTTPPRLRFLFRSDPHFGIRGLLLLPARLQRAVASRRGFTRPDHYVDRIYTSVAQLQRLLRGFRLVEVLSRSRAPRRWFWDAIVFRKSDSTPGRLSA